MGMSTVTLVSPTVIDSPRTKTYPPTHPALRIVTPREDLMTVAFGVLCDKGNSIILGADRRASYGGYSTNDACGKVFDMADRRFYAVIAGDISVAHMLESEIAHRIEQLAKFSLEAVKQEITEARTHIHATRCDEALRSALAISIDQYHHDNALRQELKDEALNVIRSTDMPVDLILAGFDDQGGPVLLGVYGKDPIREESSPGYFIIGSGSGLLHAWLTFRKQNVFMSPQRTFYHLLEGLQFAYLDPAVSKGVADLVLLQPGRGHAELSNQRIQDEWASQFFLKPTDSLDRSDARSKFNAAFGISENK
jgi:20S proteasome alpha/beta subunit